MKQDLVIYGAGSLGREIFLLIKQINQANDRWNVLGFFDDQIESGKTVAGIPILGTGMDCASWPDSLSIVLAFSDSAQKEEIYSRIKKNPKITYPTLIHPSSNSGDMETNSFGMGVMINSHSVLTTHVHLGDFVMINLACTIGHDAQVGNFSSVMPGCHISGKVNIGKSCYLGSGSVILQNISIGDNTVIGAGAVVTKSFPNASMLVGVPAINKSA